LIKEKACALFLYRIYQSSPGAYYQSSEETPLNLESNQLIYFHR